MNGKNKKIWGFTLIELLAVIVILAIILLIAMPIIINVMNDARRGAFESSAYGLIKTSENECLANMVGGTSGEMTIEFSDGTMVTGEISFSGSAPKEGQIVINEHCQVAMAISNSNWCITKDFEDKEITIVSLDSVGGVCELNGEIGCATPVEPISCNQGTVNAPLLASGMTPVYWNGCEWEEVTTSDPEWYCYDEENARWANVMTEDGSFWVWIPRYRYTMPNGLTPGEGNEQTISIVFEDGTPAKATGNAEGVGDYLTHPAFTFGSDEIEGFWVAKFMASAPVESDCHQRGHFMSDDEGCNEILEPRSQPNRRLWNHSSISNSFYSSRAMTNPGNSYGFDASEVDSHLIKNRDWGAMAYLSHSIYGKTDGEGNAIEVAANMTNYNAGGGINDAYITNTHKTTTGNIYGIYDTGGAIFHIVMGNYENKADGEWGCGFDELPTDLGDPKYYDLYEAGIESHKGDALAETSNWYGQQDWGDIAFANWYIRGGNAGSADAGIFAYWVEWGEADGLTGFRPVLVVNP